MRLLDRTFGSPEENLAFDESLLETGRETLRFWESSSYFVVLGRSGRAGDEVHTAACREFGIPVLRRASGGGAVLLGPGCLNYTLLLSLAARPELTSVSGSYRVLLKRLAGALNVPYLEVRDSDLALSGRKVSGNAQRRTKDWLLHHGTILYDFDIALIERTLREPRRRPAYRQDRSHSGFLAMLPLRPAVIKERLAVEWCQASVSISL